MGCHQSLTNVGEKNGHELAREEKMATGSGKKKLEIYIEEPLVPGGVTARD